MDMVTVFEERIIKTTEQKLNNALEKLENSEILQQNFRELADVSQHMKKVKYIMTDLVNSHDEDWKEWKDKYDELSNKSNELYLKLSNEGFENWWINTIVEFEVEQLNAVLKLARENAKKKHLGDENINDIDIFDKRWDLINHDIKQAKTLYIQSRK